MIESAELLDPLARGLGVGAMLVVGLGLWLSGVGRSVRLVVSSTTLSAACWLITESDRLCAALGQPYPLALLAYPVAALFWLSILVLFEDRPPTARNLSPVGLLLFAGVATDLAAPPLSEALWAARNVASGLLCLHAAFVIARGMRGDLVEGRRRLRGPLLGMVALFALVEVTLALVNRVSPLGPWMLFEVGEVYGGALMAALLVSIAVLFLQVRPALFGASRRIGSVADAGADAVDRLTLQKLDAVMAAEGWRREGLTIGALADDLGIPEHRLRRLINHRLGHRNFADFLNAHRIEAARRRLADPQEARTTVAVIAFDVGYGSLGPFNRAFRASTGASPTEWRREALRVSPSLETAV